MGLDYSPLDLRSKNLFKRCIQCNPLTSASCPSCKTDEVCTLTPASCDRCAEYTCIAASDSGAVEYKPTSSGKSVAPVIAGSVIGGVILISIGVFLLWKYALKGKRRESVPIWEPAEFPMEKSGNNTPRSHRSSFSGAGTSRMSTHTVQSMASTVLTRASNVIQIAFIPGVTTRQSNGEGGHTPRTLVPPVPPVPLPTSPLSRNVSNNSDDIHFLPGDLRGSTYSGISTIDGSSRRSMAPSVAPSLARSSIASTLYAGNAVGVPSIKPALVSVKPNHSTTSSPHTSTPPMPHLNHKKFVAGGSGKQMMIQMPVSREGGDSSSGSLNRSGSQRLKPKAVLITNRRNNGPESAVPTPSRASSPSLGILTEEKKSPVPSPSPLAENLRIQSIASDATHARGQQLDESDIDEDEASPHERSRQSLLRKESGPFSDSAVVPATVTDTLEKDDADKSKTDPFDDKNAL